MPKVIPPEKKQAILQEYRQNLNAMLTANHQDVSPTTVLRYAREAGLPIKRARRGAFVSQRKQAILEEYRENLNATLTAVHQDVSQATVLRYARDAGFPIKRGSRRQWKPEDSWNALTAAPS